MSEWLLFDPLFRIPFMTGLCLAASLSLLGAFLRMRNEWLAAFGLSHIAAAGGMMALPLGIPVMAGAFGAAAIAMCVRVALPRVENSHYAAMILVGWALALLVGANSHQGEVIGESLLRGQLYFTYTAHLVGAGLLLLAVLGTSRWLSPRLLTARFFPDHHSANRVPVWPYRLVFGVLVVCAAVLGTICMGAFPAFALFFVPSWIAFVLVDGWYRSVFASVAIGCAAYVLAFVVSLGADQPFGPVLTGVLVVSASLRFVTSMRRRNTAVSGENMQGN